MAKKEYLLANLGSSSSSSSSSSSNNSNGKVEQSLEEAGSGSSAPAQEPRGWPTVLSSTRVNVDGNDSEEEDSGGRHGRSRRRDKRKAGYGLLISSSGSTSTRQLNAADGGEQDDEDYIEEQDEERAITTALSIPLDMDEVLEQVGFGPWWGLVLSGLCLGNAGMAGQAGILTFLSGCVRQDWGISSNDEAAISSIVFFSTAAGALVWGPWVDKRGRRKGTLLVTAGVAFFGFLTAASPNLAWLLFFRGMVGFSLGGAAAPFVYLEEISTPRHRGMVMIAYFAWWAMGTLALTGMAWLFLSAGDANRNAQADAHESSGGSGWRVLVAASAAVELVALLLLLPCIYESPRWLLAAGRKDEAEYTLRRMAKRNGRELSAEVSLKDVPRKFSEGRGGYRAVFSAPLWRRSCLLLGADFAINFCYVSTILFVMAVVQGGRGGGGAESGEGECSFDYLFILVSASGELVSLFLLFGVVDTWGRKTCSILFGLLAAFLLPFITLYNSSSSSSTTTLYGSTSSGGGGGGGGGGSSLPGSDITDDSSASGSMNNTFAYLAACGARGSVAAAVSAFSVWVPELYPTELRNTASSLSWVVGNLGSGLASFYVYDISTDYLPLCLAVSAVLVANSALLLLLPETKRSSLDLTVSLTRS